MNIEKLYPECKDYIWGGNTLVEKYGKVTDKTPCAESWELSYHPDGLTRLKDGRTLQEVATKEDLGTNVEAFPFFPVLVKFIDAKDNLSVQVHPSDDYALKHENSFGKTEMWYIVDTQPGAGIYLGFKKDTTKEEYETAIENHTLTDLLNFYKVTPGECYFIPSGTVHAIGSGCLICEIQQNSNLTYRVYDYNRLGKDGKPRELHVEKALKVTNLRKFENKKAEGEVIGASKYFTTRKLKIEGKKIFATDATTFAGLSCVQGDGKIDGKPMRAGDTYFVPANFGEYTMEGNMTVIEVEIRKYYVGIDLGGTFIKGGIVDDRGNILLQDKVPTESDKGSEVVSTNIANLVKSLLERVNMTASDVVGIGMGVPGMIDSKAGIVIYSNNLKWQDFSISEAVEKQTGIQVKIANDANVAALGEAKFGCGKDYADSVLITLGTGVGGGVVIDGKLYEGNRSAGAEFGHIVISAGGEQCTCGRKGCLEAYASATALIRDTKRCMEAHPDSKMWETYTIETVDGKTAFAYKDTDAYAKQVTDRYIEMLGEGLTNIANVIRPEVIMLGGGICAEGDNLVKPLQKYVDEHMFAGRKGPQVKILIAKLGNSAGLLGAAALLMD